MNCTISQTLKRYRLVNDFVGLRAHITLAYTLKNISVHDSRL